MRAIIIHFIYIFIFHIIYIFYIFILFIFIIRLSHCTNAQLNVHGLRGLSVLQALSSRNVQPDQSQPKHSHTTLGMG